MFELLYGECDARMRQEIKCSMLLSLRVPICLLSSVEFLCLAWRNDAVWFLYLVLKSFSVDYNPRKKLHLNPQAYTLAKERQRNIRRNNGKL